MTTATGDPPPYYWPGQQPMQNHLLPPTQTIHLVLHLSPETATLLHGLNSGILAAIKDSKETIMATLDEVLADVSDESTKLDSLATFVAGLKQQIADALSGVTLPPAVQTKIDAVFSGVEANKAKVVAAMDANIPRPAPTEPPPPPDQPAV